MGEPVITDWEDLSPGEIVVVEAPNSSTSQDSKNFKEDETVQETTLPLELRSTMQHHEVSKALKVSNYFLLNYKS